MEFQPPVCTWLAETLRKACEPPNRALKNLINKKYNATVRRLDGGRREPKK
jgi:hypothetical protein